MSASVPEGASSLDRFPPGCRDPEADDLNHLAVILHTLGYRCCREPFLVEMGKHLGLEPVRQHDRCGDTASPTSASKETARRCPALRRRFRGGVAIIGFAFAIVRW